MIWGDEPMTNQPDESRQAGLELAREAALQASGAVCSPRKGWEWWSEVNFEEEAIPRDWEFWASGQIWEIVG